MATAEAGHRNKLVQVAERMRTHVEMTGAHAHHRLAHGLEFVMQRTGGRWRLALAREGMWPSDTEVEVCRRDFCVPEGAEERRRDVMRKNPKSGRLVQYHVVELFWQER